MGCSEKSELRKTEIAEGLYTKREISKDYTLYWRVLPDTQEIEIAMKVKGMYLVNIFMYALLFRNKEFMLDKMFQRIASNFAIYF